MSKGHKKFSFPQRSIEVWNKLDTEIEEIIEKIEKVRRAAKRWVPSLRDLSYEERQEVTTAYPHRKKRKRGHDHAI